MAKKEVILREDRGDYFVDKITVDIHDDGTIYLYQYMSTPNQQYDGLVLLRGDESRKLVAALKEVL